MSPGVEQSHETTPARRVGVIGGGVMGVGVAYVCALAGGEVWVVEPDAARLQAFHRTVADTASASIARGKLDAAGAEAMRKRLIAVDGVEALPLDLDLIVESVPERVALKLDVLGRASARQPRLLATNTSAISIDRLAEAVADPAAFLGMHFFNPVWSLKLVELVRGARTSDETLERARSIVAWLGKEALTGKQL